MTWVYFGNRKRRGFILETEIEKRPEIRIYNIFLFQDIKESDYFTERGEFRVDSEGSPTLLNCLMYKLSYYR